MRCNLDGVLGRYPYASVVLAFRRAPCCKRRQRQRVAFVPTVFRFLIVVAILAGLAFAGMFALATLVEPQPREMTVTIPNSRLPAK